MPALLVAELLIWILHLLILCLSGGRHTMSPEYSVIVPTYNEHGNIAIFVQLLWQHLQHVSFEVIIVDDNSPDGTQEVVRQLQANKHPARIKLVTRSRKLGLGTAYMEGLQHAQGEFVVLMDADLSHHPKHLKVFFDKQHQTDADIVSGTRYARGGGVAGWGLVRKLTSRGANLLASFILGAQASDLTGAFRLYRKRCLVELLQKTTSKGYAFQMEVIVRAQYAGMQIEEVPIVFVDRLYGESKLGAGEYVAFIKGLCRLLISL